jgi:hypothetical protein
MRVPGGAAMSERQLPWRVLAPNLDEKNCRVVDDAGESLAYDVQRETNTTEGR